MSAGMSKARWVLCIGMMTAICAGAPQPTHARQTVAVVDLGTLARVEKELSIPICGVGYLESRQGQLDGIVAKDQEPYLERMAKSSYGKDKQFLPQLAVQLLGRKKTPAAKAILRQLVADPSLTDVLRETTARTLALDFRDASGRSILLAGLKAPGVQRRADSLSALIPVMRPKDVDAILPLARDPKFYAVDRLIHELNDHASLKRQVLARLERELKAATGDDAGRFAVTATLLGSKRHLALAGRFLSKHAAITVDDDLYQLGQMCHALAKAGHREGLDGALHLVATYAGKEPAMWKRYVLNAFFTFTDAPEEWRELQPPAALPNLQSFWKRNRDTVRFNPSTSRFE